MDNDSDKDKVLRRVRKMLNLANNEAATPGERDAAMSQVYTILAKYNLSMSEAEQSDATPQEKRIEEKREDRNFAWAREVAFAVAQLFFCKYFYVNMNKGQRVRHHFIGRESNAITANELSSWVIRSVAREANKTASAYSHNGAWERDFCKGAARRIAERCAKLRADAELAARGVSSGRDLVLASLYNAEQLANDEFLKNIGIKLQAGKDLTKKSGNWDAINSGRKFGDSVNLNRQIGSNSKPNLKLN